MVKIWIKDGLIYQTKIFLALQAVQIVLKFIILGLAVTFRITNYFSCSTITVTVCATKSLSTAAINRLTSTHSCAVI